jgi:hypothetical protein
MLPDVINLLTPHCETEPQRRMLFIAAFTAYPAVLAKVDYSGAAAEFITRVVHCMASGPVRHKVV